VQDYETVLCTSGLFSGRHYWEITVDTIVENEDIILGVALKDSNLGIKPNEEPTFWGYIVAKGVKIYPDRSGV